MKIRMTKSFLYSLFLHGTLVLLVIALLLTSQSEEKVGEEKRCKVMLTQVCACPPEKAETKPPAVQKQKKPQPVVKEEVVVQKLPEIEEKVVEEEEVVEEELLEDEQVQSVEDEAKELIVTPDTPVVLSPAAQKAIDAPPAEEISPEEAYVKAHISEIMALLRKNLYYPRMARKRGMEGKVTVRFELLENGDIKNITVVEAGHDLLSRAAVTTIERLEGKFPLPSEPLLLNVPIMYQLR